MNTTQIIRNIVTRATLVSLLALLAACGGEKEKQASNTCFSNPLIFIYCVITPSSDAPPAQNPVSAKAATSASNALAPVGVNGDIAEVLRFDAYEPNNSLDNANIVSFPGSSDAASVGVAIAGSVSGAGDDSDFFIFTPGRSGLHSLYVCAETCAEASEDSGLSIMLFDQYQTTVDGTPVGGSANLEIASDLIAGMAYYVEVRGYNTGLLQQDYQLVIVN